MGMMRLMTWSLTVNTVTVWSNGTQYGSWQHVGCSVYGHFQPEGHDKLYSCCEVFMWNTHEVHPDACPEGQSVRVRGVRSPFVCVSEKVCLCELHSRSSKVSGWVSHLRHANQQAELWYRSRSNHCVMCAKIGILDIKSRFISTQCIVRYWLRRLPRIEDHPCVNTHVYCDQLDWYQTTPNYRSP